ncbi:MAG: mechanosensitive ion channel family protein [Spirochaetota bacterium]
MGLTMSDPENGKKPGIALIILKEFYRVLLLGLSVFFAYFLISRSGIFAIEDSAKDWALKIIYLAAALLAATVFIKSLNVFFWESYRAKKNIARVPNLLRQGINTIIYAGTLFFVLQTVFKVSITGVLTATGALGVVIGLALKEMIADVFSGLILSLDRTIKIGDYVRIEGRTFEPKVGAVAQMNWRTVHVHTPENVLVVVPNTFLTNNVLTNLSEPSEKKEFELVFTFDFDIPSERVIRVLNAALHQTKEILEDPEPKTRISRVTATGVDYKVKYWIIPSRCGPGKARNFVIDNVLSSLAQSGLSLSYPKSDLFNAPMPERNLCIHGNRAGLLRKVELFSVLSPDEIATMATSLVERKVRRGESIVRAGDCGDSMFILVEGLINVFIIDQKDAVEVKVAQLRPGSYFGEMSLLTGEPRSASVTAFCESLLFEIPKESMDGILTGNPEVMVAFSNKIADTRLKNEATRLGRSCADGKGSKGELSKSILGRIRSFFRL